VTFFVEVVVTGETVTNVVVTDWLPLNVTFVEFEDGYPVGMVSGGVLTWTFPSLAPGTHTLAYRVQANDFLLHGSELVNEAVLTRDAMSAPMTASASVQVIGDYLVRVGVYNAAGELVREIRVDRFSQPINNITLLEDKIIDQLGDTVDIQYRGAVVGTWDGTNQAGEPVSNGEYFIKIDNIDPYGTVETLTEKVTVHRPLSRVQVTIYNSAGEAVRTLWAEVENPQDLVTSVALSRGTLKPSSGPSVPGAGNEVEITLSNGVVLVWDGRNDEGTIVDSGQYYVEILSEDGKGAQIVITREVAVINAADISVGVLVAAPNVVEAGDAGTKFMLTTSGFYTLRVGVYNTAGELVRKIQGLPGANEAWWESRGFANGLYIAVVEVLTPEGGIADRAVRKIVVFRKN
jgi:flagellar hook assembly protein FlgD